MITKIWKINDKQLVIADTITDAVKVFEKNYNDIEIHKIEAVFAGDFPRRYDALIDTKLIK